MTARQLASLVAMLMVAGLVILGAGFVWFIAVAQQAGPPPPHADGIVVLTGGAERVETGLRLLVAGRADRLLISGVAHAAALPELARRAGLDAAALPPNVTLGRSATSTLGNAGETAEWVQAHTIHSLIVVTAGYHMPRALLELERALPGVTLYPVRVHPPGLQEPGLLRLLAAEYVRLIAAGVGLSHLAHSRAAS